ncbi:MarR family winged helix-turn-helix transcriptional regulator [Pelagicoccus mobilis]|uniref:MarR family transcriptional regulator n=1 Tax=Pelagicoccus mobilis TaxID=415221 RepID=A0A934S1T3_9BACT|nr:MarR family transcriptional regulator [Pelagicoccus mobilis]MBK1878292.1 MarR family transcriptional regulator [Pelagicoccus mobilis]
MNPRQPLVHANVVQLSIAYQHLSAKLNQDLRPLGLNMTQLSILTRFSRFEGLRETISSLAAAMQMNQPATTKAVQALVSNGWLARTPDEKDARITHITITPAGLQQLGAAHQACGPTVDAAYANHSVEELQTFLQLQTKLADAVT